MELFEALKSGPALYVTIAGALAALFKTIKGIFEFHDGHLQRRSLKKLAFLADEAKGNEALQGLIAGAREEEVFRAIIGRTASPEFIKVVSQLWSTDKFSLTELRAAHIYLKVQDGRIWIHLGVGAAVVFWGSFFIVVLMGIYVSTVLVPLLYVLSLATYASALLLFCVYLFFAWFVGRDARDVLVARRVKAKIEALPAPAQTPNEDPVPAA
ncbi:hypothetical protein [Aquabacterium sp. CECT 9606]|uniref:hypothetical protein n=1 Tax=Aquabacterium sp. CECT 9606 TaxID=2845822 RepID=UPI001E462A1F|nr:hypothetical protein [Aquabacterium sp. CECT 9606]CAH0354043.1 hypothetical protein AQB9606_03446 [Aquabacterium sp. CECT 9606]